MKRSRFSRLAMSLVFMAGGSTMVTACDGQLAQEFRSAAAQGLKDGVTTIATSLIDGLFAVITPDETT